jgi:phosphoglycolate phosphatase-like HAD superfamily hydrolase
MAAGKGTLAGRLHRYPLVPWDNPYLRDYVRGYGEAHRRQLAGVRARLPAWVAGAAGREAAEARAEGRAPRPPAAVLDIDEVVLCNIHMGEFHAPAGAQGPEPVDFYAADYFAAPDGTPWPRGSLINPLLPGARELIEALQGLGARVFFVTGRLESVRGETVENFERVGLAGAGAPFARDELLRPGGALYMCPDAEYPALGTSVRPYKESRRRAIEETYRIAVNVGDQISDLGLYGDAQVHVPQPFYWIP